MAARALSSLSFWPHVTGSIEQIQSNQAKVSQKSVQVSQKSISFRNDQHGTKGNITLVVARFVLDAGQMCRAVFVGVCHTCLVRLRLTKVVVVVNQ
jgi:hypothetical protein